ncbi:hypothetical protein [Cetobacterium sp. SF1]|uniref:hypothetical protein n=1 Tax=unclassified Cetobacterium TaxID=2630983 RepID=UPI003CED844B
MGKILVKLEKIDEYICGNYFYQSKDMIVLPTVKDYLKEKNIEIVYEHNLKKRIEIILENDYGITDSEKVEKIIEKVEVELQKWV